MVDDAKDHAEDDHVEEEDGEDVLDGPEEGHAAQVSEEQGRIAQRGEAAAHVGDHEDEEYDDVSLALTPIVGADHGTDHEHGRTGGTYPAGEHRAYEQHDDVVLGGAGDGALDGDAAGHDKQAQEQHDEGHIVEHDRLDELVGQLMAAVGDAKGDAEDKGPEDGHVKLMPLPPLAFDKREDSD